MDVMLNGPSPIVKEEKGAECVGGKEDGLDVPMKLEGGSSRQGGQRSNLSSREGKGLDISKQGLVACVSERSSPHTTSAPSSSSPRESKGTNQDDQLEWTRAEMGVVKQENERLKTSLDRIMKDYQSLEMHLFDIVQRGHDKEPVQNPRIRKETHETELVSLSLGASSSGHKKEEKTATSFSKAKEDEKMESVLSLGLDSKFDAGCSQHSEHQTIASRESSFEEQKEEESAGEAWPPSKLLKTLRSGDGDASQQKPAKRARVSVRVRCDSATINDGCQWRKYGQKIAKGNPCPRAYYRCTVAPACPVRKQVQRCADDMSILITTYEGTHNHPLSISATAMASTTSAAACMLMSGSSASPPATGFMATAISSGAAATTSNIGSLNFSSLFDFSRHRQFYQPNPSIVTSSLSCPTITLDLTTTTPSSSSSPSLPTQFNRLSSSFPSTTSYSQTSLSFTSSEYANTSGYLSYVNQPYSTNSQIGYSNLGRTPQEPFYNSFLHKVATNSAPVACTQPPLTDTIAAATKAITSDPGFQSAVVAAITSIVGGHGNQGAVETSNRSVRWGEQPSPVSAFVPSPNGNGCGSSYLTTSTSSSPNQQQGSFMFLQPSVPFPSSKSTSAPPPVETREHID